MTGASPAPRYSVDLPNRVLVTGAAGAIGGAIVARLAAAGVEVIATDIVGRPEGSKAAAWVDADLASESKRGKCVQTTGTGSLIYARQQTDPQSDLGATTRHWATMPTP